MIIIGITGSVGSGKSETCKFFKERNIPVFDSDLEVRLLYQKPGVLGQIENQFPDAFKNKLLFKDILTSIVFKNPEKLRLLENIIYKKLRFISHKWIRQQIRKRKKIVVMDVPLLFEKDNTIKYDKIIVVTCSEKIQRHRVLKRKGWNEERLLRTIEQQLDDKEKRNLADLVIFTDRGKRIVYNNIFKLIKKSSRMINRTGDIIVNSFQK